MKQEIIRRRQYERAKALNRTKAVDDDDVDEAELAWHRARMELELLSSGR